MNNVTTLLDAIYDYQYENVAKEKEFKKELETIISGEYNGNFIEFMNDMLFTEKYISIRFLVERLCDKPYF